MTLNQIAQQAMDYLDSVGVAADWGIKNKQLNIYTDSYHFLCTKDSEIMMMAIRYRYPQKSPA